MPLPGPRLTLSACTTLCRLLPCAGRFDTAMDLIDAVRQDLLGDGLLTVNRVAPPERDDASGTIGLERIWSSRPEAYPVAGRKRKSPTDWTRRLLMRSEVFVGEGAPSLAQVFDDSRLILSLGLRSIVNVPLVRADGSCFATFNVLGTRDRWTAEEIALIELLGAFALPHASRRCPADETGTGEARSPGRVPSPVLDA